MKSTCVAVAVPEIKDTLQVAADTAEVIKQIDSMTDEFLELGSCKGASLVIELSSHPSSSFH